MSLKPVFIFLLLAVIAIYLAFLNPHEINFHITQSYSLQLPFVVFLLGAILVGAILTVFLSWAVEIRRSIWQRRSNIIHKREEKDRRKLGELYEKAETAFTEGRFDKAESIFNKVLRQYPQHAGSLHRLGILKRKAGQYDQAIDLHGQAAKQAPDDPEVLLSLSEDYLESGQDETAMEVLQKLREADRNSLVPLYKIRDFHLREECWDKAHSVQKDIMRLIKDSGEQKKEQNRLSEIIYTKGMSLYKEKQLKAAITEFKQAIRENEHSAPAYITLGDIYSQEDKRRKALKTWKTGFEKTRSPVCLQKIQQTLQKSEKSEEVIKLYKNAISTAHNAEKNALILALGAIFLGQGKPDEAIGTLNTIEQNPSLIHHILLAKSYQAQNNTDKAKLTSQSVFDTAEESVFAYTCRACHTPLEEWRGHCPTCKAWDSAVSRIDLSIPSANSN